MPERVLPNPLTGDEIRKAILDRLSARLAKDGYLNQNLAYDYYSAEVTIKIVAHDCGRLAEVNVTEQINDGIPVAEAEEVEGEFQIEPQPPNVERVETGQPVPVLSKDSQGTQIVKGVRYKRPATEKVSK